MFCENCPMNDYCDDYDYCYFEDHTIEDYYDEEFGNKADYDYDTFWEEV